ncbi:MAG: chaperonin GroEL [Candidatus Atribacteria bacterium]|jgi:chaperonin GroEL|uniref:Chaperonin GroEL n=1 Tax=Thermatribacter velox TaxID=3039681 RepID=A0ABZ2Y8B0_9BACT|nr:chaperonin GroEL [Candidatus Atribacteria bacterium]
MAAKRVVLGIEAQKAIKNGINKVANLVRLTLGPKGRNVVIERKYGPPLVSNDGVTIAREVEIENYLEELGSKLAKEVATKTNDVVGDGTTTALVLAQTMIEEGLKATTIACNPVLLRQGMEKALKQVIEFIENSSISIESSEQIVQVASISANDVAIGRLIAQAMEKVGRDGVITVEESPSSQTVLELVEGIQFDRGFLSPYMITNPEKMEAVLENPYILVTDFKISTSRALLPLLQKIHQRGASLLIIAEELEGEALTTLVVNKLQGVLKVLAVKAPAFGERRKEILKDIAVLTGAQVISQELGMKLEKVTLDLLGRADKVVATKEKTTIIGGKGNKKDIEERIKQIKVQIDRATSEYDREKLRERLAKLVGGVAVIKVGAPTETELKEKKFRVEDALAATQAATEKGIVPGGGAILVHASQRVSNLNFENEDQRVGANIICKALEEPAKRIAENAGFNGALVVATIKEKPVGWGFDAMAGNFVQMQDAGIVDPTKVVLTALQNAFSMASLVLTTQAIVAELKE